MNKELMCSFNMKTETFHIFLYNKNNTVHVKNVAQSPLHKKTKIDGQKVINNIIVIVWRRI